MKKNTHPEYRLVLFIDVSSGDRHLCGSTVQTKDKEVFEGVEYPAVYCSTTSKSHPYFTGKSGFVDKAGRVDKFNKRYGGAKVEAVSKAD